MYTNQPCKRSRAQLVKPSVSAQSQFDGENDRLLRPLQVDVFILWCSIMEA
jgi:hypothetical protein